MCEGVQVGQRGEAKPSPCQGSPLLKMEVVGTAVRCEREDLDWSFFALLLYLSTPTPYRRGHSPPICGWHICFVKDEYSHNYFVYVVIISPEESRWTLQCSFRTGDGAQVRPSNPSMCDYCTSVSCSSAAICFLLGVPAKKRQIKEYTLLERKNKIWIRPNEMLNIVMVSMVFKLGGGAVTATTKKTPLEEGVIKVSEKTRHVLKQQLGANSCMSGLLKHLNLFKTMTYT